MVLSDDRAVDAMIERIEAAVGASILIDHTTTSPSGTKARLQRAHARGRRMLHAPVFMTPQMCRDCIGLMLVSGPAETFEAAQSVLEAMTGDVWYVGEREDLAAAYKIFGNSMVFSLTAGIADVFAMARNLDVPLADAAALFTRFKPGGMIAPRAQKIASGDRTATFELTMARKDVQLMLDAAGAEPLLVLPAVAKRMDEAIAAGRGKEDSGAIAT
jgi:3-hydroxyisobutyrate dehydrogenase-like beta-hydroxyacid dehydrogenase